MVWQLLFTSANSKLIALVAAVGARDMFALFFIMVMVLFVIAVVRRRLIPCVLSCLGWLVFSFAVWISAEPTDGLTSGMSLFSILMFFVMLVLSVYLAFQYLKAQAGEKKRVIAEEIM